MTPIQRCARLVGSAWTRRRRVGLAAGMVSLLAVFAVSQHIMSVRDMGQIVIHWATCQIDVEAEAAPAAPRTQLGAPPPHSYAYNALYADSRSVIRRRVIVHQPQHNVRLAGRLAIAELRLRRGRLLLELLALPPLTPAHLRDRMGLGIPGHRVC